MRVVDELDLGALGFDGIDPATTGCPAYHPPAAQALEILGGPAFGKPQQVVLPKSGATRRQRAHLKTTVTLCGRNSVISLARCVGRLFLSLFITLEIVANCPLFSLSDVLQERIAFHTFEPATLRLLEVVAHGGLCSH